MFDIQQSVTDDQYEIFVNYGNGYSTGNKGTIDGFITESKNLVGFTGASCNTAFKVKSYDPLLKTGKFAWSHNSTGYCSSAPPFSFEEVDETSFEVKVLGGKGVIITEFSPVYKKNNTGDGVGGKLLFGEALGGQNGNTPGVYSGELRLRSVKAQQPSTRYQFYASPEFTNSFIKGYGIPDFPYADANK